MSLHSALLSAKLASGNSGKIEGYDVLVRLFNGVKLVNKFGRDDSELPSVTTGYVLLADSTGALLQTIDGLYLAVKNA